MRFKRDRRAPIHLEVIEPLVVDLLLLRAGLPDLPLRRGALLAARVAERSGRHGVLALANAALVAELPDEVQAGDTLRLAVHDVDGDKVLLKLAAPPTPAGAAAAPPPVPPPPPAPVRLPLPDGGEASVRARRDRRDGHEAVVLRYESPALGPLDLTVALGGGGIEVAVRADAGGAHAAASGGADELRDAVAAATGRSARVSVSARPFEAYV